VGKSVLFFLPRGKIYAHFRKIGRIHCQREIDLGDLEFVLETIKNIHEMIS